MQKIGIRFEDKYLMERRVPLVPDHVKQLTEEGIEFEVVKSAKRVFKDHEFENAGAKLVDEIKDSEIILGVKEMPIGYFTENRTYIFFSHTIKGQEYNMPLLRDMMDNKINLIDYERIADEHGRRLIFFGRFAGLAGMINSLWSMGQRYKELGIDTPFLKIKQTHLYNSLDDAKDIIREVGNEIAEQGLPGEISPLTFAVTGYGNVSNGAQEILDLLPCEDISPSKLKQLESIGDYSSRKVYKTVFKEGDLSKPRGSDKSFDLQEYYNYPDRFEDQFQQYIPYISCLMNCMYWDDRYPRIVTKDYLEKLFNEGSPKLVVIGDVTCDPDGSIECTHKGTEIEDPVFVYDPFKRKPFMGFKGTGVLVMAVDILPSELPREASQTFSDALFQFIPEIAKAVFDEPFEKLKLPSPIKKALILHNGRLTPDYEYLNEYLT